MPKKNSGHDEAYWAQQLSAVEARSGGRLGVAVQLADGSFALRHRAQERFPMCSTFKLLLAAQMMQLDEQGHVSLDTLVPYTRADLLSYAPVTSERVDEGRMSVRDLCAATVLVSDNTAANLLLKMQGGPQGFTQWVCGLGDLSTRLDRIEPEMNQWLPGELRDTTTPEAMAATVQEILQGGDDAWLNDQHRALLRDWMVKSPTGDKRLRAGMPRNWTVGGKTGTGFDAAGIFNEVASVWWGDAARPEFTVAAYLEGALKLDPELRQKALAEVGSVVANWWSETRKG